MSQFNESVANQVISQNKDIVKVYEDKKLNLIGSTFSYWIPPDKTIIVKRLTSLLNIFSNYLDLIREF